MPVVGCGWKCFVGDQRVDLSDVSPHWYRVSMCCGGLRNLLQQDQEAEEGLGTLGRCVHRKIKGQTAGDGNEGP